MTTDEITHHRHQDMTPRQYEQVLAAIRSLDDKFSLALQSNMNALNLAIVQLTEAHHKSLLEQERRNGQFATIDRVDAISRRLDDAIKEAGTVAANRETTLSTSFTGYVISALITGTAVVLAFVLAHLVH